MYMSVNQNDKLINLNFLKKPWIVVMDGCDFAIVYYEIISKTLIF
jgi:hypothetical protein